MRMTRILVGASCLTAALIASPAASAVWTPKPLPPDARVENAQVVTFDGTINADGSCTIAGSMGGPAAARMRADEIATDYEACRARYRVGRIPAGAPDPADEADAATAEAQGFTGGARQAVAGPTRSLVIKRGHYLRQWFEDPAQIDVTVLRDQLQWNYWSASGCLTAAYWYRRASWFTPTFWSLESVDDNFALYCSYAFVNSTAHFRNGWFCPNVLNLPEVVHVYFTRNRVTGYPGGGWAYSWAYRITSTLDVCRRLLSHHVTHGWQDPWR